MKGNKTHRHDLNPLEKLMHDRFIKDFGTGISMEQITMPLDNYGKPERYLTKQEKELIISAIQWLESPVGQGFLSDCGFNHNAIKD